MEMVSYNPEETELRIGELQKLYQELTTLKYVPESTDDSLTFLEAKAVHALLVDAQTELLLLIEETIATLQEIRSGMSGIDNVVAGSTGQIGS